MVDNEGISYTEAEYRRGLEVRKPCLVYIPADDVPVLPKHFEPDPTKLAKLQRWKAELKRRHTIAFYRNTIDLVSRVAIDLPKAKQHLADGTLVVASAGARIRSDDSSFLAAEQNEHLRTVWVFAPQPLETMPDDMHAALRTQVARNLLAGVQYVYFVESDAAIARIVQLVERLAKVAAVPYQEAITRIRKNVSVCVLDAPSFLTHFTVHFAHDGRVDVFQSVVLHDRNDQITKLEPARAREVAGRIGQMIQNTVQFEQGDLVIRKKIV